MKDNRKKRPPKPMTQGRLDRLAVAYLQRHPASEAHFQGVMRRKLERANQRAPGDPTEQERWLGTCTDKLRRSGMLDDHALARAIASSLQRRERTSRASIVARLRRKLLSDESIAEAIDALDDGDPSQSSAQDLRAAIHVARRRRLGAFGDPNLRSERLRKELAALARRGFSYAVARRVLECERDELDELDELTRH